MINFQASTTLAAARAHVSSLRWLLAVWALFAIGAALELDSWQAGVAWFLALALATGFDALLGKSYLATRSVSERRTSGALFAWGCAFSSMMFAAMPILLAAQGGGSGRVLGVLMAASAFVRVMVFMSRARGLMIVVGAPAVFALIAMPFIPYQEGPADAVQGALGVVCGVVAFLAYVLRASLNQDAMFARLEAAHKEAKDRQFEAEAKRAEAVEANRAKSEFLAVMTHELRTPLNAVIGYAEIVEEDLIAAGRGDLARDANRIEKSARHLLGLIDQILNLTSMDAGHDASAPRDVELRPLIEEALAAVQDEARARNNRMSLRIEEGAGLLFTDAAKLSVCIGALISNAVKFTENGLIAIMATREGEGELVLSVSDTGCGIAAGDLERIFMPFVQADSTATRAAGGMGLGLSIAQRIARNLGGDIRVVSEVGAGSTFTLRLPMRLPADARVRVAA